MAEFFVKAPLKSAFDPLQTLDRFANKRRMAKKVLAGAVVLFAGAAAYWLSIPDECRWDDRFFACDDYLAPDDPNSIDLDGGF
jgi:hypothetical protein